MDSLANLLKYAKIHKHVQKSLDIIEDAVQKYGVENLAISFNGGKDSTAVLHLVHSKLHDKNPNNNGNKLVAFYSQLPDFFEEEVDFVQCSLTRYNLKLMQYNQSSLKSCLCEFKKDMPNIKAIFIGTRRDDLKSSAAQMKPFSLTDTGWPEYMRVSPILDWTYEQVWDFIRQLKVPYCDLYNRGYSSLGTKSNTIKNSHLMRFDDRNQPYYLPAWHLSKDQEERLSRSSSSENQQQTTVE